MNLRRLAIEKNTEAIKTIQYLVKKKNKDAFDILRKLSLHGNSEVQYFFGELFEHGEVVQKNMNEALKWYSLAAKKGNSDAAKKIQELAEQKDPNALYNLGFLYEHGYVIAKDIERALELYVGLAVQGNSDAKRRLKELANQGNISAQYSLAVMYEAGTGFSRNIEKALTWQGKVTEYCSKDALAARKRNDRALKYLHELQIYNYDNITTKLAKNYEFHDPNDGFVLVLKDEDYDYDEIEENSRTGFYICAHQVTQKEWLDVMGSNPSYFRGENRPVEQVSWYDAVKYCNALSLLKGLSQCYAIDIYNKDSYNKNEYDDVKWIVRCNFAADGYRLPTEEEWEFAATGGNKSKKYIYSGSDVLNKVAWFCSNSDGITHDVKTKSPNELGLYDMSGNVWEWCWDWYEDVLFGKYRVIRGGAWNFDGCSVYERDSDSPHNRNFSFGFRVVRSYSE